MARVQRFWTDAAQLRKPERTAQGFLRVDGIAARVGIQEYLNPDGTISRELRLPEEVFKADSLQGYEGAPFVVGHPRDAVGEPIEVTAANVWKYEKGTVMAAGRVDDSGEYVLTTTIIKDPETIKRVESRELTHLSTGYVSDLVMSPGVHPKYGRYDAVQTNIRINHQALVKNGRAGVAKLRLDEAISLVAGYKVTDLVDGHQHVVYPDCANTSWSTSSGSDKGHDHVVIRSSDGSIQLTANDGHTHAIVDTNPSVTIPRTDHDNPRGMTMDPEKLQETIVELNNNLKKTQTELGAVTAARDAAVMRADEAQGKLVVLEKENTDLRTQVQRVGDATATAAVQTEKKRADEAEGTVVALNKSIPLMVRARASLVATAQRVVGSKVRLDDLDDRQIRVECIKRLDSAADVGKDVSDGIITGMFLSLIAARARNARDLADVTETLVQMPRVDEQRADAELEKKREEFRNQGTAPLPSTRFKGPGART